MICPYCRTSLMDSPSRCPDCGMDAAGVARWLGNPPRLLPGLNDLAKFLSPREARQFLRARDFLRARHPQCDIHWVLATFPPPAPLSVYAFHVFNHGGLCQSLHTAGANRDLLLLTDTDSRQSSLTIGYGLEPFVKESTLDALLADILPDLQSGKPARAAVRLIESWAATSTASSTPCRAPSASPTPAKSKSASMNRSHAPCAASRQPIDFQAFRFSPWQIPLHRFIAVPPADATPGIPHPAGVV